MRRWDRGLLAVIADGLLIALAGIAIGLLMHGCWWYG